MPTLGGFLEGIFGVVKKGVVALLVALGILGLGVLIGSCCRWLAG